MKRISLSIIACIGLAAVFAFTAVQQDAPAEGTNIGNKAPEIKMKNPDGKMLSLSSLKGNIVLLDFWASWCGPCRGENPNVVSAYNKFHKAAFKDAKGFEIFSVSLDKQDGLQNWKNAIKQDGLVWPNHVSDLKWWSNEAAMKYGINSIPMNFLLDKNGVIIAKNLRGDLLEKELKKLVSE